MTAAAPLRIHVILEPPRERRGLLSGRPAFRAPERVPQEIARRRSFMVSQMGQPRSTSRWLPKSVLLLRRYSARDFVADLMSGVTVGLVALPLAMAFAISSSVSPQSGIYCAIVTGFLISALGGSRFQIGGPTGAFVVVVAGIVGSYGVDGLFMCTMMAGVLLVVLGITGMGTAVRFLPRPVVICFTNGIAVLIASTQIRDFFGLQVASVPSEFAERI